MRCSWLCGNGSNNGSDYNSVSRHQKKLSADCICEISFSLRWYAKIIFQIRARFECLIMTLEYSEGGTRLAMPKTRLRARLIVIEAWFRGYSGSPGLGGIRTAGLCTTSGLLKRKDTRLKTSARVWMGLSLAWKASLAIRILYFLPCNRLHVNPSSPVSI